MNDFAEPAVAEPVAVSEPQGETEDQQQPETPQDEAKPTEPRRSRREALEKAFSDVDEDGDKGGSDKDVKAEPKKTEAKTEPKAEKAPEKKAETKTDEPARGPDGKFAPKDATTATDKPADAEKAPDTKGKLTEAPSRFSEDAKKAWADAPESIKGEVTRALRETEQGIQKYQQAFEPIKPFLQMANGDPQKLGAVMQRYVNTEQMLQKNPVQGFSEIARNMGLSPQQVGKALLGQEPGQPDQRDREIHQLRQQVEQLTNGYTQVNQTLSQQREQSVLSQVEQFAVDHPRFDELSEDIALFLETGKAQDLKEAYALADRVNPAPAPAAQEEPPAQPAQTRPARSVTGAPTSGSNPVNRKPSNSRKEALETAMRRAGF